MKLKRGDWVTGITESENKECYQVYCRRGNNLWITLNNKKYTETSWFVKEDDVYITKVTDFVKYKKIL